LRYQRHNKLALHIPQTWQSDLPFKQAVVTAPLDCRSNDVRVRDIAAEVCGSHHFAALRGNAEDPFANPRL